MQFRSKRLSKNYNAMIQLTMAHDMLCDTIDIHNAAFTVQFMLNLVNTMSTLLFSTFNIINTLIKGSTDNIEMLSCVIYLVFAAFYLYFINCLIFAAALVKFEGNRSAGILQRSAKYRAGSVAMANILSLQFQHRTPHISTGFFVSDLTLFYTVIPNEIVYILNNMLSF